MRIMATKAKWAAMPPLPLLNKKGLGPMFKKLAIGTAFALAFAPAALQAAGGAEQHIEDFAFSYEGPSAHMIKTSCSAACKSIPRSAQPAMA